jgi:HEAT repeat protein
MLSLVVIGLLVTPQTFAIADDLLDSIKKFENLLLNGDNKERREAAYQLYQLGEKSAPAVPTLLKALNDNEQQVWYYSVQTLAKIGPQAEAAVPDLIQDLARFSGEPDEGSRRYSSGNRQIWYRSAFALGSIGKAALPPLIEALSDKNPSLRSGAAKAISWLAKDAEPAIPHLVSNLSDESTDVRYRSSETLARIGKPAIEPILLILNHESPDARAAAAKSLAGMGIRANSATQVIVEKLQSESELEVTVALIEALSHARYEDAKLAPLLMTYLEGENKDLEHAAINALLTLPSAKEVTVPNLMKLLLGEDSKQKTKAAYVLGRIGYDAAASVPDMITAYIATRDSKEIYREAIANVGEPAILPLIIHAYSSDHTIENSLDWIVKTMTDMGEITMDSMANALESRSVEVRFVALRVIQNLGIAAKALGPKTLNLVSTQSEILRAQALSTSEAIGVDGEELEPIIAKALADPSDVVKTAALRTAEAIGEDSVTLLAPIMNHVESPNPKVQEAAIRALGAIGSEADSSVSILTEKLDSEHQQIVIASAESLGKIGRKSKPSTHRLLELVTEGEVALKVAALNSVASLGPNNTVSLEPIIESLEHSDPEVRKASIGALSEIDQNPDTVVPYLIARLQDDDHSVRERSSVAVGKFRKDGRNAEPVLFNLLKREEDRKYALDCLRQIEPQSLDLLIEALKSDDGGVRLFSCDALRKLGSKAKPALAELSNLRKNDQSRYIRGRAREAIEEIEGESS